MKSSISLFSRRIAFVTYVVLMAHVEIRSAAAAKFAFPGDYVTATAVANSQSRHAWRSLTNDQYGQVARAWINSNALAESKCDIKFANYPTQFARLELNTFANTGNVYPNCSAHMNTSIIAGGGPYWIPVKILPTSGESIGKPVTVTLTFKYSGRNSAPQSARPNYNFVQAGYQGNLVWSGHDTGSPNLQTTVRFRSTVGSVFNVALQIKSVAPYRGAMTGTLIMEMQVQ